MRRTAFILLGLFLILLMASPGFGGEARQREAALEDARQNEYNVGIDDVLEISILQPEKLSNVVTVAPDGTISFPYVGNIYVRGFTLKDIREKIRSELSRGYMKYPVVSVSLRQSRSRKFFVYGEVVHPGAYPIEEDTTVLRAISSAGGFTKYGSSSRVKILRSKNGGPGYDLIKVNVRAIMQGKAEEDVILRADDIVVVSEGAF
ncbi:MAG: polysaccharide biosynthesis/export family protein [Candidatus Omnitrophota bacterium]